MKDPKLAWAWVGGAVVVIVIIIWMAPPLWHSTPGQPTSTGPTPVYAPQGQLTPQFPKGLILDSNAAVNSSYSIGYSQNANQYTAEYFSSSTVDALFNDYQAYFLNNGWNLTGVNNAQTSTQAMVATQASSSVQVVITADASGKETRVIVSDVVQ